MKISHCLPSRCFHVAATLVLGLSSVVVNAQVVASDAWARATVPAQKAGGAFMTLQADQPLSLVAAESAVAGRTEIHESLMQNDVMRMREIEKIALEPGKPLKLAPGGYHVMLMQLRQQLKEGEQVGITLTFEKADGEPYTLPVTVEVRNMAASMKGHGGHSMKHGSHDMKSDGKTMKHGDQEKMHKGKTN